MFDTQYLSNYVISLIGNNMSRVQLSRDPERLRSWP